MFWFATLLLVGYCKTIHIPDDFKPFINGLSSINPISAWMADTLSPRRRQFQATNEQTDKQKYIAIA